MSDRLHEAGVVVTHLARALLDGSRDLSTVPGLVGRIIEDELWKAWADPVSGRKFGPFRSFRQFVKTPAEEGGLGADEDLLYRLCPDLTTELDEAFGRKPRSDKIIANRNIITESDDLEAARGTSRRNALRRLRKNRPDLHARVLADELSPHAAMIEAGYRSRTITVRPDDPKSAAQTLRRHMKPEHLAALKELL